ncbi:ABC transporter ATP-binding protein [Paenibacillus puldeungensis]|uniref:ABC transporter ATP-binding protein n=1 Tax=Paenibacillus puldeungensis TaxID=696536 RepID=A0ABW3S4B1_9BACL
MPTILRTQKLTKSIGGKEIVSHVDIHVNKGDIYGFLGPNGAGKTTIMKMITNLWKPTSGEIELFGEKLTSTSYEVLKRMGSIIEYPVFYERLSGRENLELHGEYMGYYSPNSVQKAMDMLELSYTDHKPVRSYSLGMKQRLGIARAILTKPEFLVLDEPTNGLDPAGIKQMRDLLKVLCHEYGITIMISSHLLSEIQNLATKIGVIHHGKMVKEIAIQEILDMNLAYVELTTSNIQHASFVLADKLNIHNFKVVDDNKLRIYEKQSSVEELTKGLAMNDVPIESINGQVESLEDYFLKITGEDK